MFMRERWDSCEMHFILGEAEAVAGISDLCAGSETSQLEICICSDAFFSAPKNSSQTQLGWGKGHLCVRILRCTNSSGGKRWGCTLLMIYVQFLEILQISISDKNAPIRNLELIPPVLVPSEFSPLRRDPGPVHKNMSWKSRFQLGF